VVIQIVILSVCVVDSLRECVCGMRMKRNYFYIYRLVVLLLLEALVLVAVLLKNTPDQSLRDAVFLL
jgi:uncharacterized membrane protein